MQTATFTGASIPPATSATSEENADLTGPRPLLGSCPSDANRNRMPRGHRTTYRSILTVLLLGLLAGTASAEPPKQIIFPIIGPVQYSNDFGAPALGPQPSRQRPHGRRASRPSSPSRPGEVERPALELERLRADPAPATSGTEYWYLHLNNDAPRRDDYAAAAGTASPSLRDFRNGDARACRPADRVRRELRATRAAPAPHLHFELHPEGSGAVSPYKWLRAAPRLLYAAPGARERVRLALYGKRQGDRPRASASGSTRIAVSTGWRGTPAISRVSLGVRRGLVVERQTKPGALGLAALASARAGERVSVWTSWFAPSLATQMAGANVLAAAKIRLRGL